MHQQNRCTMVWIFVVSGLLASSSFPMVPWICFGGGRLSPPHSCRPTLVGPSRAVCLSLEQPPYLHLASWTPFPASTSWAKWCQDRQSQPRASISALASRADGQGVLPALTPQTLCLPSCHCAFSQVCALVSRNPAFSFSLVWTSS